jgi:hypothetical protein
MVMRLSLLSSGICCLLAILFIKAGVPRQIAVLLLIPALLGVLGAIWFAVDLLVKRPIEKILLGESLQVWPSRTTYSALDIAHLEFVSRPDRDDSETCALGDDREVRMTVRSRWNYVSIGLILDPADVTHLTNWATEKGIPIVGADHER